MSLYGEVFRRALMPVWEGVVRQRPTLDYLARLERMQWASRDELEAYQLDALKALLRHAWQNVPYYREALDACGLGPYGLKSLDDLARVPILTRELAAEAPERRMCTGEPRPTVKKQTSGSTGKPLVFAYDLNSDHWRTAVKLRGYGWAGYRQGELSLHFWGAAAKPPPRVQAAKIAVDRGLRREVYADCGRRGDAELAAVVELIRARRPHVMVCYTQAGADLARYMVARGLRTPETLPVICGAERLFPADREVMVQAFGPAVFETYGSREVMLMATESEAHDGLLVQMENLIVEVLVREPDGRLRAAEPGETGEVVVTDLHNWGMPFIRYANGDLAVAGPRGKSACGRAHTRLAAIEGRVTETLRDAQGGRVSGLVFNVMFASLGHTARQFQVVQHGDRSITLKVVPTEAWSGTAAETARGHAARYLPGVPFRVETVAEIPTSPGGKRQVVVVEKPASA